MDRKWISQTTSGVFSYLYNQITGEDDTARTYSSRSALSKGVWIKGLPTNNYEPLEASHGARAMAKKVGVGFISLPFLNHFSNKTPLFMTNAGPNDTLFSKNTRIFARSSKKILFFLFQRRVFFKIG